MGCAPSIKLSAFKYLSVKSGRLWGKYCANPVFHHAIESQKKSRHKLIRIGSNIPLRKIMTTDNGLREIEKNILKIVSNVSPSCLSFEAHAL